jgi:hypothetical protein
VAEHELVACDPGDPFEETCQATVIDGVIRRGQRLGDGAAQIVASPPSMIGEGGDEERKAGRDRSAS